MLRRFFETVVTMAWDGEKERPEVALKMASREQVLDVLAYWAAHGCSLKQALARKHVPAEAFWERSNRHEPEVETMWRAVKGQWAFAAMDDVYDQATAFAAAGNVGAMAVRAKHAGTMAKAMDQNTWGDKVQVESKVLNITTNLDFRICSDLQGITVVGEDVSDGLEEARRAICGQMQAIGGAVVQAEAEKKAEPVEAVEVATEADIEAIFRAQGGRPIVRPRSE